MSKVLSVKLEKEKMKAIEEIAVEERSDRSTVARKLLEVGINQWKLEKAVQSVISGKASVWKASEIAGVSLRDLLAVLDDRKVPWVKISSEELERELAQMRKEN